MEKELWMFQQANNTEKMEKGRSDTVFSQGNHWKCIFANHNVHLEQKSKGVNASPQTVSQLRIAQCWHHLIF